MRQSQPCCNPRKRHIHPLFAEKRSFSGPAVAPAGGDPYFHDMKDLLSSFVSNIANLKRVVGLLIIMVIGAGHAIAACTDAAADNVNWRRCYMDGRDLKGVSLGQAMLREATFQRSDLSDAKLSGADAYRAKFLSARMARAVMDDTRLIEADLTRADLSGASLKGADLRNAKLVGAVMKGADLTGARLEGADLRNADLTGARWADGRVCGDGSVGQCH